MQMHFISHCGERSEISCLLSGNVPPRPRVEDKGIPGVVWCCGRKQSYVGVQLTGRRSAGVSNTSPLPRQRGGAPRTAALESAAKALCSWETPLRGSNRSGGRCTPSGRTRWLSFSTEQMLDGVASGRGAIHITEPLIGGAAGCNEAAHGVVDKQRCRLQ
ncbi:hypothetical protein NDU88_008152 [Pleurodeles waltl]|uniref:Uncharacterized protein n=1 Tax=Pleurodeles waltl TaxID=8319 RepID=A0AAV7N448_PLEWA|nr:hypothetical protein NDU88_008152 [Pleurodeles waltl]